MSLYTVDLRFSKAQNRLCQHYRADVEAQTKQEAFFIATQLAKNDGFKGAVITQKAQLAREVEA